MFINSIFSSGKDSNTGQIVAIKRFKNSYSDVRIQFENEISVLTRYDILLLFYKLLCGKSRSVNMKVCDNSQISNPSLKGPQQTNSILNVLGLMSE